MKQIWKQLDQRRQDVAAHPFFTWLNSDSVPLEQRFMFTPVMIDFIMSFADMNKWFLSYENPKSDLERSINEHTEEDRTHSRLFHHNWYTLDLGDTPAWTPSKALWWLFEAGDAAVVRRFGMEVLDSTVNYPDPLVRFAMMEAIEICGDVFFANTAPVAAALSEKHGVDHHYFGHYHRERETGHLHTDENAFLGADLSDEQRRDASFVVAQIFDNFLQVLDQLLSYSQRAVADQLGLQRDLEDEYLESLTPPPPAPASVPAPVDRVVSASQLPLLRRLGQRTERLRRHPFLGWLAKANRTPRQEKLQRFLAIWGIDVVGYKDFNDLVLSYRNPTCDAERAINRWTGDLATHGALYLQDWKALGMDQILGWDMGESIAYYFLSEQTEVHRHNMARVKTYAMRHKDPILRFWLINALERSKDPLFACTRQIAESVEDQLGITLNYWTDRRELAHPVREPNADLDGFPFLGMDLDADQVEVAMAMIDVVFDNMEAQFDLSHEEATSGVFLRDPRSLPPPRLSGLVFHDTELATGIHAKPAERVARRAS